MFLYRTKNATFWEEYVLASHEVPIQPPSYDGSSSKQLESIGLDRYSQFNLTISAHSYLNGPQVSELQSFRPDGRGFDFHVHAIGDRGVNEGLLRF